MTSPRPRGRLEAVTEGAPVTPLELFLDLVFVYAFTQVTEVLGSTPEIRGLVRGLLLLALLWWCWCCFAWLGNVVQADEGVARLAIFGVMAAMFVAALTIPEAFEDLPGGLNGPVVFAACYFVVRVLHLVVFWLASAADPRLRRVTVRLAVPMLGGTLLLVAAAAVDVQPVRTALWAAALAVDYAGVYALGARDWLIHSAAHWTERHGLIIIIALGESVVSIGVGVGLLPISWPVVVAAVLGIAVAASLWWTYFDVVAIAAERVLARADETTRARLARDSYTYLHLPMVAGIIGVSLGLKKVLAYVADPTAHALSEPLHGVPLYALYGGTIVYLLGHFGFRLRNMHSVNRPRLVTMGLLVVATPVAAHLPALAALGLLTTVLIGLVGFEVVRYREARRALRHAGHDHD